MKRHEYSWFPALVGLVALLLSGCAEAFQTAAPPQQPKPPATYGPRWIDYRGWSKLEAGMAKSAVLEVLGEPFLPHEGANSGGKNFEVLVFKIRSKYYKLRDNVVVAQTVDGARTSKVLSSSYVVKEVVPEKFADTDHWGDVVDLYCTFENGKLARWECPSVGREAVPQVEEEKK